MERHIEHLVAFLGRRLEQCSDFGGLVDGELRRAAQGAATVPFYPGKDKPRVSARRTTTWLREEKALRINSSLLPSAMMRP